MPPEERSGEERAAAERYDRSRTDEEYACFQHALMETMDLWYAHQGTTVYLLTQMPEGSERTVGYADSGWTTYERCSAEQIKKASLFHATWKLVLDLGAGGTAAEATREWREWPTGPDDFDALIERKTFANGADKDSVKTLFRKMSEGLLGGVDELDYVTMRPPTVEEGRRLGRCLSLCANLEVLNIFNVGVSDEACAAVWETLGPRSLPMMTELRLYKNKIGDAGMQALAAAVTRGSLAKLKELFLYNNLISDRGVASFSDAIVNGGLANLEILNLSNNKVNDPGMESLSDAIGRNGLASLNQLTMRRNPGSTASVRAACEARAIGCYVFERGS